MKLRMNDCARDECEEETTAIRIQELRKDAAMFARTLLEAGIRPPGRVPLAAPPETSALTRGGVPT